MKRVDDKGIVVLLALILACIIVAVPAYARHPADTLTVFGVGARADAMGDAFVAVANDASATFWNPAGLTLLPKRELTTVFKQLPAVNMVGSFTNAGLTPPFASLEDITTDYDVSQGSGTGEATFFATTLPIGTRGVLGISQSVAGYSNQQKRLLGQFSTTPVVGELVSLQWDSHSIGRVDQTALTYGWKSSQQLSLGIGVVASRGEMKSHGIGTLEYVETTVDDPLNPGSDMIATTTSDTAASDVNTSGRGYGYTIGSLWTPKLSKTGEWTLGGSYMSKVSLKDLDREAFGDETGDRLMLGASYRRQVHGLDQMMWSFQIARFGSANTEIGGQVARQAVWNLYFGGEYQMYRDSPVTTKRQIYQIRYGLFTNRSPNEEFYDSEKWLTLGLGAGRADKQWQAELAWQHAIGNNMSLLSMSANREF